MDDLFGPFNDLSEHYATKHFFGKDENLVPDRSKINPMLVNKLEEIYKFLDNQPEYKGKGFPLLGGYRSKNHPDERKKKVPGSHTHGIAADVDVSQHGDIEKLYRLLDKQPFMKDTSLGVYPDGKSLHIDVRGKNFRWGALKKANGDNEYLTADEAFRRFKSRKRVK